MSLHAFDLFKIKIVNKLTLIATLNSQSAIYASNLKSLRESSIEESVIFSNMRFDTLETDRVQTPERDKLSKISQSIIPSRQSGII